MILAEKIVQLRKRNNWSQEDLAEKLDVSRQSVSKWEGAQSVPDLDRIIKLSEIFQVSTDYLLKDDVTESSATYTDSFNGDYVRSITLEEANSFINDKKQSSIAIGFGVVCCILSPVLLIFLSGLASFGNTGLTEGLAAGIGIVFLLILVIVAVSIFITTDLKLHKYDYLSNEPFTLSYGVPQVIKEKKDRNASKLAMGIISGVALCIISPVPIIIGALVSAADLVLIICVCALFFIVALAVFIFIYSGTEGECYKQLLQTEEYSPERKGEAKREEKIGGVYWPLVTIAYLLTSFLTGAWHMTWLIWPCAGILFGAICVILKKD